MEAIRERVIFALRAGETPTEIATRFEISRKTVYNIKKLYDETGGFKKREKGGERPSVRTDAFVAEIKAEIEANPVRSIRQIARERGVDEKTIRNVIKDIGGKSKAIKQVQLVTPEQAAKRLERAKVILNQLKRNRPGIILFSDEKNFHVDRVLNRRNDRYIELPDNPVSASSKFGARTKHPATVMVLGVLGSDGKVCPPIFVPEGLKVTAEVYQRLLKEKVLPWIEENYPEDTVTFQQDGAPAHTAKTTQQLLKSTVRFWDKSVWPPSSPDLNPLDYY